MVNFNLVGGVVWVLNGILYRIIGSMRGVGPTRSASISGWVSGLVGLWLLNHYQISPFTQITSSGALIIGIIVVFAILLTILPILRPQTNFGILKDLVKVVRDIGKFMGVVMGLLCAILIP